MRTSIAALAHNHNRLETTQYPSMGEQINKPWYNSDYTDTTIWIHLQVNYTE